MLDVLLVALVAFGLAAALVMRLSQRSMLRDRPALASGPLPPVSILKPLKGADESLADNLRTVFRQDYPGFEVVFSVRDADDPAIGVARAVAAEFPGVPSRVVIDGRCVGANPKVNNLANALVHARHGVILINDSNVAVPPGHVREFAAHLLQPGIGLVSSPIRGHGGRGMGARLESYQLNTFVMGGVAATHRRLRLPCVVGKSMGLRRADLERLGGFAHLSRFLAEDQVCGEEVHGLGLRTAVCATPVDNVLGRLDVREFSRRHLRWARIRRHISPAGYAAEILLNPVFLGLVGAALLRTPLAAATAAVALLAMSALGAWSERSLGVRRSLLAYAPLEALRAVLTGILWPVPFFSRHVSWRGHRFRLGRRTVLIPAPTRAAA
jgi:ceramide glucosyltransferase